MCEAEGAAHGREMVEDMRTGMLRQSACLVLALCALACALCPLCALASQPEYGDFSALNGKTVAMLTGAPFEELIRSQAPGVSAFQYFTNVPDMEMALEGGKIDAYLMNNAIAELAVNRNPALALFPETLGDTSFGFAFKKGDPARDAWQAAFDGIPESARQALWEKWTGADESVKTLPGQDWPGEAGAVHVAVCDTLEPMCYRGASGEIIGFDVEMILLMAKQLDVHVVFDGMEFSSVMPAVQSGKALMGAGSIVVSDERRELVDFLVYAPAAFVLVVRATDGAPVKGGFWDRVQDSFTRTFIRDGRYKMVLSGLGVTLLITFASGALGTLLGFGLVRLRHRDVDAVNRLISMYGNLIAGIPAVVILMVLYYIVFGAVQLPAVLVAIIGFALIFGARAYGVIWSAVSAVDGGQREAALALGYTREQAFGKIVLPQSRPVYLPLLQAQLVQLLKETCMAGYITVLELTRAGDLIRSRTMEAFFPLIAVALVYLLLTRLLTQLVRLVDRHYDRQRKARRIKGVDE